MNQPALPPYARFASTREPPARPPSISGHALLLRRDPHVEPGYGRRASGFAGCSIFPRRVLACLAALVVLTIDVPAAFAHEPSIERSCADGRWQIGLGAVLGSASSDALVIAGDRAVIESGCGPGRMRIGGRRRDGTIALRGAFKDCAGGAQVKLKGEINAACTSMAIETITRTRGARRSRAALELLAWKGTCTAAGASTFAQIEEQIFAGHGCNVASCHGAAALGGLDLRAGQAWLELIGQTAHNAVAAAAGKRLVEPGDAINSFLSQKLHGGLGSGEGSQMPAVGSLLSPSELWLVDAWIDAGAPQAGEIHDAPCVVAEEFVETPKPAPPEGGYQVELEGPWVLPGNEFEGCMWIPVPNELPLDVARFEYAVNPGTHHFALFPWTGSGQPSQPGVLVAGDVGCISGGGFGLTLSGSPQAPYYVAEYPPGMARRMATGGWIGVNPHYANHFDQPIQVKGWVNFVPYEGTPEHILQPWIDYDEMFSINVPYGTQRLQPGSLTNSSGGTMAIVQLTGHQHKRGLRFRARNSAGVLLYENWDWAHPPTEVFDPPLMLPPGGRLDYDCLIDNGVDREPRLNASGSPTTLRFGTTSDDEMCVLSGTYYVASASRAFLEPLSTLLD